MSIIPFYCLYKIKKNIKIDDRLLTEDDYNDIEDFEEEELRYNTNLKLVKLDCLQTFINIKMIICLICLFLSYY